MPQWFQLPLLSNNAVCEAFSRGMHSSPFCKVKGAATAASLPPDKGAPVVNRAAECART